MSQAKKIPEIYKREAVSWTGRKMSRDTGHTSNGSSDTGSKGSR